MSKNNADQLRARLRSLRQSMSVAERQHASTVLCTLLREWFEPLFAQSPRTARATPLVVAGFWTLEFEPDLRPLLQELDLHQVIVCLPVMVQPAAPLEFHRWKANTKLLSAAFGVQEPPRSRPLVPDIVLVPTLGFTAQGARLGYGGGYYDRTLESLQRSGKTPLTLGIAWQQGLLRQAMGTAAQHCVTQPEVEAFAPEPHDVILKAIVTPQGWLPARPPRANRPLKLPDSGIS
jgi:5-formyltetrahydrofolate cyclo-ligase